MNLENELKAALKREDAPPDFAAKVLARAGRRPLRTLPWFRRPMTLALAAGLAAAVIIPSAMVQYRQQREIEQRARAEKDLMLALSITRDQLQNVRNKVQGR